jgi:predicted histone-like DNA-binding protein
MAEYDMQELTLPNEEGKRIFYPKMQLYGQKDLEEIAETISNATTFTRGDIVGLVQAITEEIAHNMGGGYSVKIKGLGIFTPALGLREGKERESDEEGEPKRNAASICLKDIHFKADKELVYETARNCHLQRARYKKCRRSSQLFSPQERLGMAKEYLRKNLIMSVADYCRLTGLLKTAAATELREWEENPETGIGSKGRRTHKVYVLKPGDNTAM